MKSFEPTHPRDPHFPLRRLLRTDKWYLGGGDRLLWAPPFPEWLDHPGLWDEVHYFNHALYPCFTWTLLSGNGWAYPLRRSRWQWSPAGALASLVPSAFPMHGATPMDGPPEGPPGEVTVEEALAVTPDDRICAEVQIEADAAAWEEGLHLVAWTAQPDTGGLYVLRDGRETRSGDFAAGPWGILWTRTLLPPKGPAIELRCRMRLDREADSWAVQLSEGRHPQPHWGLTPWATRSAAPGLSKEVLQTGNSPHGLHYGGLHLRLVPDAVGRARVIIHFEIVGEVGEGAPRSEVVRVGAGTVRGAPGSGPERVPVDTGAEEPDALFSVPAAREMPSLLLHHSTQAWGDALEGVPEFRCSDPYLEAAWWHRWYALRLLEVKGGHGYQRYPAVCEGIAHFRVPISYSAHAHMRDLRWRHDPAAAKGTIRNFLANQREDGSLPGRIYHNTTQRTDFYLADWGGALRALTEIHPDPDLLEEAYEPLTRYAGWFDRERDREESGLYDVVSQFETGQEYMSRYMAVSSEADTVGWVENFRLKAVDATVYMYRLKQALAEFARRLGRAGEEAGWRAGADRIAEAVRTLMWDPEEQWFSDVDPRTMQRTGIKAAVGFYPFMAGLAGEEHLGAIWNHLLDPEKFWTPCPVPATSADDPWFDPDARWRGKRMNCPWNGRVWPMTNSHVFEGLARAAYRFDETLKPYAASFLDRFVRMMFTGGDPGRPNTFEHYHPYTGEPCFYRGIDDYMHSWLADLIVRYVVGLQPDPPALLLHPLDMGLDHLVCRDIPYHGHRIDVAIEGGQARVWVDGRVAAEGGQGTPLEITLDI